MITIIVGTNRERSNSLAIAQLYQLALTSRQVSSQILDLRTLPSDFVFTECFGNRTAQYETLLKTYIEDASKYVFILPEYHGGFPGVVKAFLDSFSGDLVRGKHAALVGLSAGRAGNLRGLDAFAGVLSYLQVEVLSNRPKLSGIDNIFLDGVLDSTEGMDRIERQIDQLIGM